MRLEEYFEFLGPNDIRLRGSRVGIELVLDEYVHRGQEPAAIAAQFPSLRLEQVYATILYYLRNQAEISPYLARWVEYCRRAEQEYDHNPPDVVRRLLKLKEEREAAA